MRTGSFKVNYKSVKNWQVTYNIQPLLDKLTNSDFNYAGFVEFPNGIRVIGVYNENHFQCQFGKHVSRCFFIGRGSNTWDGIYQFGGRRYGNQEPIPMLNPNNLKSKLMDILPTII